MDTRDIKSVYQVKIDGSVTKAAGNLYITPQALSKIIKKVEDELGIELFFRTSKGMQPTERGKVFFEKCESLIYDLNGLQTLFTHDIDNAHGKIKIVSSLGIIGVIMPENILEFNNQYPNFEIKIEECVDKRVDEIIYSEEADIGLAIYPVDEKKYETIPLKAVPHYAIINKKDPLSRKKEISIFDLKGMKIALESSEFKVFDKFKKLCLESGFEPDVFFETTEISLAHRLACNNKCIAISVKSELKDIDDEVVWLPFKENFQWEWCLIRKKNKPKSKIEEKFIQYMIDLCRS